MLLRYFFGKPVSWYFAFTADIPTDEVWEFISSG